MAVGDWLATLSQWSSAFALKTAWERTMASTDHHAETRGQESPRASNLRKQARCLRTVACSLAVQNGHTCGCRADTCLPSMKKQRIPSQWDVGATSLLRPPTRGGFYRPPTARRTTTPLPHDVAWGLGRRCPLAGGEARARARSSASQLRLGRQRLPAERCQYSARSHKRLA